MPAVEVRVAPRWRFRRETTTVAHLLSRISTKWD